MVKLPKDEDTPEKRVTKIVGLRLHKYSTKTDTGTVQEYG